MKVEQLVHLLRVAEQLNWTTQGTLLKIEDKYLPMREIVHINQKVTPHLQKYLYLGSLPFVIHENDYAFQNDKQHYQNILDQLWPFDWFDFSNDLLDTEWNGRLPTLPRGNLKPEIMIVGDAPGIGSSPGQFDRTMTWGPSSHMLRKALITLKLFHKSWFTNLVKVSQLENKPTTLETVKDWKIYLNEELRLLQPKIVLLLGNHVAEMFEEEYQPFGVLAYSNQLTKVVKIYHPTYIVRIGRTYQAYAEHIQSEIQKTQER